MATPDEVADENRRVRQIRQIVDFTTSFIMQAQPSRAEAEQLVSAVRHRILTLFPGSDGTYEVVYSQKFKQIIDEFAKESSGLQRRVLPFRYRHR